MDQDTKVHVKTEPVAGTGLRNLDTWRKLAAARASLAVSQQGEQLANDPAALFKRFGLDELAPHVDSPSLQELEAQLAAASPMHDLQLDARRGAVAVVGPVVVAVAYNKAGVVQVGGAVNIGVNLNVVKNVNETCGTGLY